MRMIVKSIVKCALLFGCLCFSLTSHAWNAVGHMLVAQIAYDRLQPTVRAKVDKMVMDFSAEYPYITDFVHLAPWLDSVRGQKIEVFKHWHYIDAAFAVDGVPVTKAIDTDNALWAMEKITLIVKNQRANRYERARFLAFLIHIAADLHQPLHTVSRFSLAHPDGDAGGNLFAVKYQGRTKSLHALWDGGVGSLPHEVSSDSIRALAQRVTSAYPESFFGDRVDNLDSMVWAKEGAALATQLVYATTENQAISTQYEQQGQQRALQQMALAGYRLAHMLNQMLKSSPKSFS